MTTPISVPSTITSPTMQVLIRSLTASASQYTSSSYAGSATANRSSDNNHAASIIFGVFGITIALIGVVLAWLQLRTFHRRRRDDEDVPAAEPTIRLVET